MTDNAETVADEFRVLDILEVIAENLRLLLLAPLAIAVLAWGFTYTLPTTFTANTKFMPPQPQQNGAAAALGALGALGGLTGAAGGIKNPADQYVVFAKSRTVQDALVDRFKLVERDGARTREEARNNLDSAVAITGGKEGFVTIEVTDKDASFAAKLANAYIEELSKFLSRMAVTEAQQRRMFFQKQLDAAKENLVKAEQALKDSGIDANVLKATPQSAIEGVARLKASITAQEIKLSSLRGYMAESSPELKQAQFVLSAMREQLHKSESEESTVGEDGSDYIAKFREFKYQETLFEMFAKQYEIAKVDESREGATIQVVDFAYPPEHKNKPRRIVIAFLAALASIFLLSIFIFLRQVLRIALRAPGAAEQMARLRHARKKAIGI